jgi:hypothetical protein
MVVITMRKRTKEQIDMVKIIFKMRNEFYSYKTIGEKIGKTKEFVRQVLNGSLYRDIIEEYGLKINHNVMPYSSRKVINYDLLHRIVEDIKRGFDYKDIAQKYNLNQKSLITTIFNPNCSSYKKELELLGYDLKYIRNLLYMNSRKFTKEDIAKIFALKKNGMSQKDIAILFKTSQTHISSILTGRSYKKYLNALNLQPISSRKK